MQKKIGYLKNVRLQSKRFCGDDSWVLIHHVSGEEDPFFSYYAEHLIEQRKSRNTRKSYCRHVAQFIDYLIESGKHAVESGVEYLDLNYLVQVVKLYPKVLAGGIDSRYELVSIMAKRLCWKSLRLESQNVHLAAINKYLELSEDFNLKMNELNIAQVNGISLFSDQQLFPGVVSRKLVPDIERIKMSENSMLSGVIAGGSRLRRICALKADIGNVRTDNNIKFDHNKAFPIENSLNLIRNGFKNFRDKSLYSFLMASGCRIHEALLITWDDINVEGKHVFLIDPKEKSIDDYLGYLNYEEIKMLPWKKRKTKETLLIEPFASEFWKCLELYQKKEMIFTSQHPFVWQITRGKRIGHPFYLSDSKDRREAFNKACSRIKIYGFSPHSLRHMYGVYCRNYFPKESGDFGLSLSKVQNIMGHSSPISTEKYAIPDMDFLRLEQEVFIERIGGIENFSVNDIKLKIMSRKLNELEENINNKNQ